MYKLIYFILLVGLSSQNNLFAQQKYEKESRIKRGDVPASALLFVDSIHYNPKIKWYREQGLTGESIEAKFNHIKTKYSIEFDTLGNIEDIEIEVNWKDIGIDISNPITTQLKLDCSSYKVSKIQEQYSGNEADLLLLLGEGKRSDQLKLKHEVVVKCRKQKEVTLNEYLFNEQFVVERKLQIIFKNSSHLEY